MRWRRDREGRNQNEGNIVRIDSSVTDPDPKDRLTFWVSRIWIQYDPDPVPYFYSAPLRLLIIIVNLFPIFNYFFAKKISLTH
jgi:hypothetical protein